MASSPNYSDLPEVYSEPHGNLPEVTPPPPLEHSTAAHSLPETLRGPYKDGKDPTSNGPNYAAIPAEKAPRICGMKRKTFLIVAAIIGVIIIGAVVGGAVGATVSKKSDDSDDDASNADSTATSSATPESTAASSLDSALAVTNWTDSQGYQHYFLFHQDENNNIIESYYDSQNKTWKARSVSASLKEANLNVDVIEKTPIAVTAWANSVYNWNIRLYVLTAGNLVGELMVTNYSEDTQWQQGNLGTKYSITTGEGSNLAAHRPTGGNRTWPAVMLLYQDPNNIITYTTSLDDWDYQAEFQEGTNRSGLAVSAFTYDVKYRIYYGHSDELQEGAIDDELSQLGYTNTLGDLEDTPTGNYAAIVFDSNNMMVVNLKVDGSLTARYWDSEEWSDETEPTFRNYDGSGSPNITAIAGHGDKRVYTIVEDSILEWSFASQTPLEWSYLGEVNITVSD